MQIKIAKTNKQTNNPPTFSGDMENKQDSSF